jgi:hypothetical protein
MKEVRRKRAKSPRTGDPVVLEGEGVSAHQFQDKDHFDLLPFIAILMCTLGCLLFVTLSVAALSIGPGRGEGWVPDKAEGTQKTPVLVEWDGTVAVLHREGHRIKVRWHSSGPDVPPPPPPGAAPGAPEGPPGAPAPPTPPGPPGMPGAPAGAAPDAALSDPSSQMTFDQMLDWFATNKATQYALFAVRPSGFESFRDFSDEFRNRQIDVGYEPIDQKRTVTLMTGRSAP